MTELQEQGLDSGPDGPNGIGNVEEISASMGLRKAIGALVLFLLFGLFFFPAGGVDDAHITYWPAYTLAHFGKILNYNGEAIEQSSSLLYVVVLGALHFVSRASIPLLGWLVGILCGMGAIVTSVRIAGRLAPKRSRTAGVLLAISFPFTYWAFSGMETSCAAWAGSAWLLALVTSRRTNARSDALRLAPWTLAYLAVRPEAFAVMLCTLIGSALLSVRVRELRASLVPAGVSFAGCAVLLFGLRKICFGTWLPQTVLAKSGSPLDSFAEGWNYVTLEPTLLSLVLLALVGAAVQALVERRPLGAFVLSFLAAQTGFIVFSGGDWMEGGRFFAPVLPVALPAVVGLMLSWFPTATRFPYFVLFVAIVFAGTRFTARESKSLTSWSNARIEFTGHSLDLAFPEAKNKVHLRDVPLITVMSAIVSSLAKSQEEPVLIFTGQGGMALYHLGVEQYGSFEVIDRFGLMDRTLSSSELVRSLGHHRLGRRVTWSALFDNWDTIQRETGMREPDVYFDVSFPAAVRKELKARGYVLRYVQKGIVISDSPLLPGWAQPAGAFVWIKRSRRAEIPRDVPRSFEFSPAPWD